MSKSFEVPSAVPLVFFQNISPFSKRIKPKSFDTFSAATESNAQRNKPSLRGKKSSGVTHFSESQIIRAGVVMGNTKTKPKILKFARTEHGTKNTFWLFEIDSQIKTALIFATAKTTYAKILREGREQLWMEYFDEVKNNPTYSIIIAKHAHGKVWNCFLFIFFTVLKSEIHHYLVNSLKFPVG